MFRFLRWFVGYQSTELTAFQAAVAANIRATTNYKTLRGPVGPDLDLAA